MASQVSNWIGARRPDQAAHFGHDNRSPRGHEKSGAARRCPDHDSIGNSCADLCVIHIDIDEDQTIARPDHHLVDGAQLACRVPTLQHESFTDEVVTRNQAIENLCQFSAITSGQETDGPVVDRQDGTFRAQIEQSKNRTVPSHGHNKIEILGNRLFAERDQFDPVAGEEGAPFSTPTRRRSLPGVFSRRPRCARPS